MKEYRVIVPHITINERAIEIKEKIEDIGFLCYIDEVDINMT